MVALWIVLAFVGGFVVGFVTAWAFVAKAARHGSLSIDGVDLVKKPTKGEA